MRRLNREPIAERVLARLRLVCLDLPEAYEEAAWAGIRWCVSKKNFAHVLMIGDGWPPAYAEAANTAHGCVLTFRLSEANSRSARFSRRPFFRPLWFPNIVGVMLTADTDWEELDALLVESYCALAPKRLRALVER